MSRSVGARILDLLFPPHCPICGNKSGTDGCLCPSCLEKYSAEQKERCPVCGKTAGDCTCGLAGISRTFLGDKKIIALTFYHPHGSNPERVTETLVRKFKKRYDRSLTDLFARDISGKLLLLMKASGEDPGKWVVTFPPRSTENKQKYGFDQGEYAVRSISRYTGIPRGRTLRRTGGEEQKELGRGERVLNSISLKLERRADVRGKKIILFDDIITTGATVRAATDLLVDAGAECVFPVCIARVQKEQRKYKREERSGI